MSLYNISTKVLPHQNVSINHTISYAFSTRRLERDHVTQLFFYKNYDEVIRVATQYISSFQEEKKEDPNYIFAHEMLGKSFHMNEDYEPALIHHKAWLSLSLQKYGEIHTSTWDAYKQLGKLYADLSYVDEGLEYLKKSLIIAKRLAETSKAELVLTYRDLGLIYHRLGRYAESIETLTMAVELAEKGKIPVPLSSALGRVYRDKGNLQKALEYFQKALKEERNKETQVAQIYTELAQVYIQLGKTSEAFSYATKSLDIYMKHLKKKENLDIAYTYQTLAQCYASLKEYEKAEVFGKRALDLRIKIQGPVSHFVAKSYKVLGTIYSSMQRIDDAALNYHKGIDILTQIYGPLHPDLTAVQSLLENLNINSVHEMSEK